MKYQSLLIHTGNNLSLEELNSSLKASIEMAQDINELNSFQVDLTKNSIGIADLEEINAWINLKTIAMKFVVINNAESLTVEAQNSLLKNLEEPPENTQFVLLTKNIEKSLETIRSRSIQLSLNAGFANKSEYSEFAQKYINSSYLERIKMSENIQKEYESREEIAEIVFVILKNLPVNKTKIQKTEIIRSIYVGIKSSVNLKLCLDLLAISI